MKIGPPFGAAFFFLPFSSKKVANSFKGIWGRSRPLAAARGGSPPEDI